MGTTLNLLNHVRSLIAPTDDVLRETRARRDAVLAATATYGDGAIVRTYVSGSVASGLANRPIDDGALLH